MNSNAADILAELGIRSPSIAPGRYYAVCPKCSASRKPAHQKLECLGITIDDDGVHWGCNHCDFRGGKRFATNGASGRGDPQFEAIYDYVDETGALLFQVCRKPRKAGFLQRKPDGKGGFIWKAGDVRKVLYRLPELIEATASDRVVLLVEGEKDCENLRAIGMPATCSPGGASEPGKASKWRTEYSEILRGADLVVIPDHDAPGYAHAECAAKTTIGIAKRVRVLRLADHWLDCPQGGDVSDWLAAGHTREELDQLVASAPECKAQTVSGRGQQQQLNGLLSDRLVYERVADVPAVPVEWIWPGRIARRKLTLIAGDPGVGKSQITCDVTARISTGAEWPDGNRAPLGSTIILSAEDSVGDTLRPRLEAAKADLERVHVLKGAITAEGAVRSFALQSDLRLLGEKLSELGDVANVIIDPLTSYMGKIDSHRTTDVRGVLEPLADFADRYKVSVLAVTHPPKATQAKALHAITGSLAFVAAARLVFIAVEEPETERRLLLPVKNNLGPLASGIGFSLAQVAIGDGIHTSHVVWDSAPVTVTASEALWAAADAAKNHAARDEAEGFLKDALAAGAALAQDVKEKASAADISERTLRRARKSLGIIVTKDGYQGKTQWSLPNES
jgi:hypothetical protein